MEEKNRVYTLSQVAQHRSNKDIWFTIYGRVLDVTEFSKEHPGSEEVLVEYAGKDATKGFEAIGHSKEAYNLLLKFQVGYLQGYSISQVDKHADKEFGKKKEMEAFVIKNDLNPKQSILAEFFVLALVIAFYFGYQFMTGAVHFAF